MSQPSSVRITIGTTVLTGRLRDNPTARDLMSQLPLTVEFRHFNEVEIVAELPRALTMVGVPAGDDPEPGEIGYYAPTRGLVLWYGDIGYWNGIVRLGRFDGGTNVVRDLPRSFTAVVERGQ
jgi:hypothetical protein